MKIRLLLAWLIALMGSPLSAGLASAATNEPRVHRSAVAQRGCAAIAGRVAASGGDQPVLLRSYDDARGAGEISEPAQRTAAYTYDNALAVIALLACGRHAEAVRVGEALRLAAMHDTRLRNVYRAGVVGEKVLPNGWWSATENRWVEDAYQQGSATGVVAWAGLALLGLFEATKQPQWQIAAARLGHWVVDNAADTRGAGGFSGGSDGFDTQPTKLMWKSTEQNIDLVALFGWLAQLEPNALWKNSAAAARHFVDAQWDATSGHFWIGTLADGRTPNRSSAALDVQLWAQLLPGAPMQWRRAVAYAEHANGVAGGFDFNEDRDGLWLEGTAQAALVYRKLDRSNDAEKLLATIDAQFSTGGFVYATREPRITTGLSIGPASTSADFYYYRRPHLGATAWAVLAALNRNPFVAD